jgi:hypothetical protein
MGDLTRLGGWLPCGFIVATDGGMVSRLSLSVSLTRVFLRPQLYASHQKALVHGIDPGKDTNT